MLADITIQQSRLLTAYATQIPFVRAIENVAEIHPQILSEFEVGALPMWHDDEFAGEHCSLMHCLYTNCSGSLSSYQKREGDRTLNGLLINICYKSEILYPLAS